VKSLIVDGVPLAYRVDGPEDAPPLILINSLGTDYGMWAAQVAALSRSLRIIRYDIRGHGHSGVSDAPVTIARLADDLLALLDHLEIARAHLCGLSLGGVIALWLAIHHPERVSRAVFANTAARIGSIESWSARMAFVRGGGMVAVRELVLARFFSEQFRARHPEVANSFGAMLEASDPAGYIAACAALRDADLRPIVSTIRIPSLIITGMLDEATPVSQAEELHAAIAGSELVVLPEASHLSNVEQPEAFNTQLLRFLRHE
jgi:3-oxoadipate enol-lactonase